MRLALISDIHGNLPALEAVLAELEKRQVDAVCHLGDLVGYAPWPNEVVQLIRARGIGGVAGNYDSTVATDHEHCGCKYEDPTQAELAHQSYDWTRAHVDDSTRQYLATLPFRLDLRPRGGHAGGPRLILVHGTPTLNTLYWTEDRSESFCARMIRAAGARSGDAIAFGHTHLPWQRQVEGVLLLNTGSVGRPKDGNPDAGYTVVECSAGLQAKQFRTGYDVERAANAIEASDLPEAFAHYLRSGGRSLAATGD